MGASTALTPIQARYVTGLGEAAGFTELDWVREQCRQKLGFDPYPGTLNLKVDSESQSAWLALRTAPGVTIVGQPGFCDATCQLVTINGSAQAAVLVPLVEGYPDDQIELLAATALTRQLSLSPGDPVTVMPVGLPRAP